MMQAILILAHKDEEQLLKLVDRLDDCFEVYIHIDKKMSLSDRVKKSLSSNRGLTMFPCMMLSGGVSVLLRQPLP